MRAGSLTVHANTLPTPAPRTSAVSRKSIISLCTAAAYAEPDAWCAQGNRMFRVSGV
jgi:hypothetical protein